MLLLCFPFSPVKFELSFVSIRIDISLSGSPGIDRRVFSGMILMRPSVFPL